jgi:hypothetical protein
MGPYPTELVPNSGFEETVLGVCKRPEMYIHWLRVEAVLAFIHGYNMARDGGPLRGLRE